MIEDKTIRGGVQACLGTVKSMLNGYMSHASAVYIGATSDPQRRWRRQHEGDGWSRMVQLYGTKSARSASRMETLLIAFARRTNFTTEVTNIADGGESIEPGKAYYWVYVLTKPRR